MGYGKTKRARSVAIAQGAPRTRSEVESSFETDAAAAYANQFAWTKTPPMNHGNLGAMRKKIARALAVRPECFITHPTELAALKTLSPGALENFATENGWRTVVRLGGRQVEFYNDAAARIESLG